MTNIIHRISFVTFIGAIMMTDKIYELFRRSIIVKPARRGSKLQSDTAGYVLITCTQPNSKGQMEVNLTYEGDRVLASYLLKSAQDFFLD